MKKQKDLKTFREITQLELWEELKTPYQKQITIEIKKKQLNNLKDENQRKKIN